MSFGLPFNNCTAIHSTAMSWVSGTEYGQVVNRTGVLCHEHLARLITNWPTGAEG